LFYDPLQTRKRDIFIGKLLGFGTENRTQGEGPQGRHTSSWWKTSPNNEWVGSGENGGTACPENLMSGALRGGEPVKNSLGGPGIFRRHEKEENKEVSHVGSKQFHSCPTARN